MASCGTTNNCGDWEGILFSKIICIVLSRIFSVTKKYIHLQLGYIDNYEFDRSNSTGCTRWLTDIISDRRLDNVYRMLVVIGLRSGEFWLLYLICAKLF